MNIKFDKIFQVLEAYIDKIVLGLIGVVCLFLLWVYVIGNPYGAKVDGKKRPPSQIDIYVKQKAERLADKLGQSVPPPPPLPPHARKYEKMVQNAIPDISVNLVIPYPGVGDEVIEEDRLYATPVIPDLTDVQLNHIRGAARVPDEDVGPDRPYDTVAGLPADVDLVTVSARFDIETLFNNFQQSFMGPRLKSSWKDAGLAKPVFARLHLQRRSSTGNDQWGPWEDVPPSKIETYRQRILDLPFSLSDSQYGVDIWKAQFDDPVIQQQILQPLSYDFTISRTDWMPPEFLIETLTIMEKTEKQERREELEERRSRTERPTMNRRRSTPQRPSRTRRPEPRRGRGRENTDMEMGMMGMEMGPMGMAPARAQKPKERTVEDVSKDYEKELIKETTKLDSLRELLLVWANDDTAEPGQTYQYRMRIGVFNPIAGKDWFESSQTEYKDQLVLWSHYAEPTDPVILPRRFYVFPKNVLAAKDDIVNTQGAKVEVLKYHLGLWRDYEFEVYAGETIGYEVEVEEENMSPDMMADFGGMMPGRIEQEDKNVDFSTGYTLIDIRSKTSWGPRLRPETLSQLLYYDGSAIQILPVGQSHWDRSMRDTYKDIQEQMDWEMQRKSPGMREGFDPMMVEEDMMMMF